MTLAEVAPSKADLERRQGKLIKELERFIEEVADVDFGRLEPTSRDRAGVTLGGTTSDLSQLRQKFYMNIERGE